MKRQSLRAAFLLILALTRSSGADVAPSMPMPIAEEATANYRWLRRPVLGSRLLDDAERTNSWSHHGQGEMTFTTEQAKDGQQAVRLVSATIPPNPNTRSGRPFGEAVARRDVAGEDWTEWNRVSFWVYPRLPGFHVISMLVRLRNEGETTVPDRYNREGLNFFLLRPDEWNHVVWEIAHLARDKVSGLEFVYRLQGHEPGATDRVCFDIDQVQLERVDPDPCEGWTLGPGRIAYSQSGYPLHTSKTAVASGLRAGEFTLVRQDGTAVLTKPIEPRQTELGAFQILDFTEWNQPGLYRLQAGDIQTAWFELGPDSWRPSIWKTLNFFYCERCGFAVPGIHGVCHSDWTARHETNTVVINGGWHDAGDLSQGLVNTSEAAYAMLELAERLLVPDRLAENNAELISYLLREARWGLDWMRKTRFGDGTRLTWATMDYWTDGEVGTPDDTFGQAANRPFENFLAAATEARAARVFRKEVARLVQLARADPRADSLFSWAAGSAEAEAGAALKAAREDWQFAVEKVKSPNLELAAAGALASAELFEAFPEDIFARKAFEYAGIITASQQREWTAWRIPLCGFFYTGPDHQRILHYSHRGHEQGPIAALARLCALFPDHPDWMRWYSTVVLHSEYLKRIAKWTEPWGMLPASVYSVEESKDPRFIEQVRNGIELGDGFYLRRFPVWFDFRGNTGTGLSQAKALSTAANLRGDHAAADLVQRQLQWTVGRNPFCQSLMFGEGYDYAPQYTAMSGDMVGSLPVGIQTRQERDEPYWPPANCYNYKEVWVHPSGRWLGIMADVFPPPAQAMPKSPADSDGHLDIGRLDSSENAGEVTIRATVQGKAGQTVTVRVSNLDLAHPGGKAQLGFTGEQTLTWRARRVSAREPWVAVLVPEGDLARRKEILGER